MTDLLIVYSLVPEETHFYLYRDASEDLIERVKGIQGTLVNIDTLTDEQHETHDFVGGTYDEDTGQVNLPEGCTILDPSIAFTLDRPTVVVYAGFAL